MKRRVPCIARMAAMQNRHLFIVRCTLNCLLSDGADLFPVRQPSLGVSSLDLGRSITLRPSFFVVRGAGCRNSALRGGASYVYDRRMSAAELSTC